MIQFIIQIKGVSMKKFDKCPFKGKKNAGVAIDGRIIFKFDCAYCRKKKAKKEKKSE